MLNSFFGITTTEKGGRKKWNPEHFCNNGLFVSAAAPSQLLFIFPLYGICGTKNKKMIHQTNLQVDSRTSLACYVMSYHTQILKFEFFVHSCSFSGKETLTSSLGPITPILLWPILMFSIFSI